MPATPSGYELPYDLNALEPVISRETLTLHTNLAQGYAVNFPKIIAGIPEANAAGTPQLQCQLRQQAFQGSGWELHGVYFQNMTSPGMGGEPGPLTQQAITQCFGSWESFPSLFQNAAKAVEGPGWTVLGYHREAGRLLLLNAEKHQQMTVWGVLPVLVLDVWEHAYWLDYHTDRAAYCKAWWSLINWKDVEYRLAAAMRTCNL